MRPLAIELRRNVGIFLFPAAFVLHLVAALGLIPSGTDVWINTSSAIAMGSILSGPLVGCVAAWAGTRRRRSRTAFLEVTAARPAWAAPLIEVVSLAIWAAGAYWSVAVVLLTKTALNATWGKPDLVWVCSGFAGLLVYIVVGYVLGRAIPKAFVPPIVGVVFYLLAAVNSAHFGTPWYFLDPTLVQRVTPFLSPDDGALGAQLVWYVALVALTVALLVVVVLKTRTWLAFVGLGVAAALAFAAAVPVTRVESVFRGSAQFTYVCSQDAVEICIHPAYSAYLDRIRIDFEQLTRRVAGTPYASTRIEQRMRSRPSPPVDGVRWFAFDDTSPGFTQRAIEEYIATELVPGSACIGKRDGDAGPLQLIAVRIWLAGSATAEGMPTQVATALARMSTLSDEQVRTWLIHHTDAITSCSLTWEDFA